MEIDRHKNSVARKTRRRAEAEVRNSVTAELSRDQRLQRLDTILGAGVGAKRERARLQAPPKTKATVVIHGPETMAEPAEPQGKQRRRDRKEKRGSGR